MSTTNVPVEPQAPQPSQSQHDSRSVKDNACQSLIREGLGGAIVSKLRIWVPEQRPQHENPHAEHDDIPFRESA